MGFVSFKEASFGKFKIMQRWANLFITLVFEATVLEQL